MRGKAVSQEFLVRGLDLGRHFLGYFGMYQDLVRIFGLSKDILGHSPTPMHWSHRDQSLVKGMSAKFDILKNLFLPIVSSPLTKMLHNIKK